MSDWRIERLGDAALLLRFGERIDALIDITTNRRVHACAAALRAQAPDWLVDLTPAYASLALHVDVAHIATGDPLGVAEHWLAQKMQHITSTKVAATHCVEIPVAYGGAYGPDLAALATHAGISAAETIARHTAVEYTVAMLGFAPGFPYLLGLDPALAMPRLQTPRTHVAAGSVGIGGTQTGIYPNNGPGGWQLIGRTSAPLFDASRDPPSMLQAGDRVRFVAIESTTHDVLSEPTR